MRTWISSTTICSILIIGMLFGTLNFVPTAKGEQGAPHDDGVPPDASADDNIWTTNASWLIEVSDNIVHENKTIIVNGDLSIEGSLTLINVTLQMNNATYDGEYNITVFSGGSLVIKDYDDDFTTQPDASIIQSSTAFRYGIQAYTGSQFELKNSEVYDCGWSTSPWLEGLGLFINTNWATVSGNYITDSEFGAVIYNCNNVTFTNNTILNAVDYAMYIRYAEFIKVDGNDITNVVSGTDRMGIFIRESTDSYFANNTITNVQGNFASIYVMYSLNINLSYNNIYNNPNAAGITLDGGGGHEVFDNTITDNNVGLFLIGTPGGNDELQLCYINENTITSNYNGIDVQGTEGTNAVHDIYIYDNTIQSNINYGIRLKGDGSPSLTLYSINNIFILRNYISSNGGFGGILVDYTSYLGDIGGVYCLDNEIRNNIGSGTTRAGYRLNGVSYVYIWDDYIADNDRNLWITQSDNIYVINSTLEWSGSFGDYDIRIEDPSGGVNPPSVYLLNTTFNPSYATVAGSNSFLNVRWYLHVRIVQWSNGVDNAEVWINDTFGDQEPATGQPLSTGTGNDGWIRWLRATWFNRTSTITTYYTPHDIEAKNGTAYGFAAPTMDMSKEVIIYLNNGPFADNVSSSAGSVYRTNTINIIANGSDVEDEEDELRPHFEYSDPNVSDWNNTYFGAATYIGTAPTGYWEIPFTPPGNAPVGYYDFRVRFNDTSAYYSDYATEIGIVEVLNNPPVANAGPDDTVSAGTPYYFDGSASTDDEGIVKYAWDINESDGLDWVSPDHQGVAPSHVYDTPGIYNATLNVTDAQGAWSLDKVQITAVDNDPPEANAGPDDFAKVNNPYIFDASGSTDNVGIVWYNWTFGDGFYNNGSEVNPSHIYTVIGIYVVTLICTDANGNWDIDTVTITVNPSDPPVANAGPDNSTNEDSPIIFNGSASTDDENNIVNYTWDIDDSDGVSFDDPALWGMEVKYTYLTPGVYTVTLNVTDNHGGWDWDTLIVTVFDITPPTADAGPDDTVNEDIPYNFDGSGSYDNVDIVSYAWDWNASDGIQIDNNTISASHTYTEPGIYIVTLNVSDAAGNWDIDIMVITVLDITHPTAEAGPDNTTNEDSQIFFDGSASYDNVGIVSYDWDIDDSDGLNWVTSDLQGIYPFYTYLTPGIYTVTLNVTDAAGNWHLDTLTVVVFDITPPTANAGPDDSVNEDSPYNFDGTGSNDNSGSIVWYNWSFDDGSYINGSNPTPSHEYTEPGVYLVTLTVTDPTGFSSSDMVVITVKDITKPVVNAGSDDSVNNGTDYPFDGSLSTDNSGSIAYYNWSFGDGNYANGTDPMPVHRYTTPGTYVVILTVTDGAGNSNATTITIDVFDITNPIANAGLDDTVNEGTPYTFDGSNSYDDVEIVNYAWDINASDGVDWSNPDYSDVMPTHTYFIPGIYIVTLNVSDAEGNSDIDTMVLTVLDVTDPVVNAGSSDTTDEDTLYDFDGTGSYDPEGGTIAWYNWSFGDGNYNNGSDPTPSHTYLIPGIYIVTLKVTDSAGNSDDDTIIILVNDTTNPEADAGPASDSVDEDTLYDFDGTASYDPEGGTIAWYNWSFDDGNYNNGSDPTPSHTYLIPGIYIVTLKVTDSVGLSSEDTIIILVNDTTNPEADAGPASDSVDEDTPYDFDGTGSYDPEGGTIAWYNWSFDDGNYNNGTDPAPSHSYTIPGTYTVTLKVTDSAGRSNEDTIIIIVQDTTDPEADAGPASDSVDEDAPYIFNGTGSYDPEGGNIVDYAWDINASDGIDWGSPDYNTATFSHIFNTPGTYTITLNVTDAIGRSNLDTIIIIVRDTTDPTANAGLDDSVNEGSPYTFDGSGSTDNVGVINYAWDIDDSDGIDWDDPDYTGIAPVHTYSQPGTYIVTLNASDAQNNCNHDVVIITVNDITKPTINVSFEQTMDEDVQYTFDASSSYDNTAIATYHFSFGDETEISGANAIVIHKYVDPGTYTFTVNLTDIAGNPNEASWLVTVRDTTPPLKPAGLNVSKVASGGALSISWIPNTEEDLDHYELHLSEDGVNFELYEVLSPETTSYFHPDLTNGTRYSYYIVAVDNGGLSSEASNIAHGIPDTDSDGDGIFDEEDEDDDNDSVPDENDPFPLDDEEWLDTDDDGIGNNLDNDDDNDNITDENDAFPLDSTEWYDSDEDGIGNNIDLDDDDDGVQDVNDAFPLDPDEKTDTDGDGEGNNADEDDDGDTYPDTIDAFPLNPNEWLDTDGDGIGNNADKDDDDDGAKDEDDYYPLDPDKYESPFEELLNLIFMLLAFAMIIVAVILLILLLRQKGKNNELSERIEELEQAPVAPLAEQPQEPQIATPEKKRPPSKPKQKPRSKPPKKEAPTVEKEPETAESIAFESAEEEKSEPPPPPPPPKKPPKKD